MFTKSQYLNHIQRKINEAVVDSSGGGDPPQYDPDSPIPIPYQKYNIPYDPPPVFYPNPIDDYEPGPPQYPYWTIPYLKYLGYPPELWYTFPWYAVP